MKPLRVPLFFSAVLCLGFAGACTSNNNRPFFDGGTPNDAGASNDGGLFSFDAGTDGGVLNDGGTDGGIDGGTDGGVACTASPSYGTVDAGDTQVASYSPQEGTTAESYQYQGNLNDDTDPDYIDMELYAGYGAFADGGISPGTYTLAGDDLNYATCGLCVLIFTNANPATGEPVDSYMATAGTVTLTSLQGTLSGTFTNMAFEHVTIDGNTYQSTPVGDGCVSTITSMPFSAPDPATDGGN